MSRPIVWHRALLPAVLLAATAGNAQPTPPPDPLVIPADPADPAAVERVRVQVMSPTLRYQWPEPPAWGWAARFDPASLPLLQPAVAGEETISFDPHLPQLEAELEPAEQARLAPALAGLDLAALTALNQFVLAQPVGDRGAFVRKILEDRPAALPATFRLLARLAANERQRVVRAVFIRQQHQWLAIGDLAAAVPTDVALAILLSTGSEQVCTDTAPDAQAACLAAARDFQARFGHVALGVKMELAPRGVAPWMAQLYRAGADALAQGTPLALSIERSRLGMLRNEWERLHLCGAAYLGQGWVLTAAHCIGSGWDGYDSEFFAQRRIRLGTLDINGKGQTWGISALVIHGGYSAARSGNDIALFKLKGPPEGNADERIDAVQMASRPPPLLARLRFTGWGYTGVTRDGGADRDAKNNLQSTQRLLRVGELQRLPTSRCNLNANYQNAGYKLVPGQICAGSEKGTDSCRGDSGGPLVWLPPGRRPLLVGLVSYGPGCGQADTPGVYTDVSAFAPWVAQAMARAQDGRIIHWPPRPAAKR